MDPNKIQNKMIRVANNGKLNDVGSAFIWVDGILKNKIIEIKII
tara:strand:+ start:524 stop:655 length:132 start_codon:yes stop_codon:yes gene_type:complete